MAQPKRLLRTNLRNLAYIVKRLHSTDRSYSTAIELLEEDVHQSEVIQSLNNVKSYREVPGPKSLLLIGNSWRFAPIIGG